MAFSEDHPRIVALEQAIAALARLLSPEVRACWAAELQSDADAFMAQVGNVSAEQGPTIVEIAGAINQLREDMLKD